MLPNFLHIGSAKSASTWLWEICKEHPEIYVPGDWDNPNFFTVQYHKGMEWYEKTYFDDVGDEKVVGEFSNSYVVYPPAIERIAGHLPDVKLTVTLRNPIERAYRSWAAASYQGKWGLNPSKGIGFPFEKVLTPNASSYFRHWIEPGFYAMHLERVYRFFPKERLFVMLYDDLSDDHALFVKRFFDYLGVNPDFETKLLLEDINPDTQEGHRSEGMSAELRSELRQVYDEDISRLEKMLDRDLSGWR